jgi:hypothetical protein
MCGWRLSRFYTPARSSRHPPDATIFRGAQLIAKNRHDLTQSDTFGLNRRMTEIARPLTSIEALGTAGMMMAGSSAVMCCRMCR